MHRKEEIIHWNTFMLSKEFKTELLLVQELYPMAEGY